MKYNPIPNPVSLGQRVYITEQREPSDVYKLKGDEPYVDPNRGRVDHTQTYTVPRQDFIAAVKAEHQDFVIDTLRDQFESFMKDKGLWNEVYEKGLPALSNYFEENWITMGWYVDNGAAVRNFDDYVELFTDWQLGWETLKIDGTKFSDIVDQFDPMDFQHTFLLKITNGSGEPTYIRGADIEI